MARVAIPRALGEAKRALGSLDGLVTAKQWERAAIVYAFTYDGGRGGDRTSKPGTRGLLPREFADLGIAGLYDQDTVRFYRTQWKRAMAAGYAAAEPDVTLQIPGDDVPWNEHDDRDRNRRFVEKDEVAVGRSIERGDLDADVLAQNLDDRSAIEVARRLIEDRPEVVQALVENSETAVPLVKAREAFTTQRTAAHNRREREHAPQLVETHEFVQASHLLSQARVKMRQALALVHGLPPLDEAARADLRQELDGIDEASAWLRELAKARRSAGVVGEIEEYLAEVDQ